MSEMNPEVMELLRQAQLEGVLTCPKCGTKLQIRAKHCAKCGWENLLKKLALV